MGVKREGKQSHLIDERNIRLKHKDSRWITDFPYSNYNYQEKSSSRLTFFYKLVSYVLLCLRKRRDGELVEEVEAVVGDRVRCNSSRFMNYRWDERGAPLEDSLADSWSVF